MPRGIDRVDLALARYFFASDAPRDVYGILPTPWGVRAFPADRVRRGLKRLEALWAEEIDVEADPVWTELRRRLRARDGADASPSLVEERRALPLWRKMTRLCGLLAATGIGLGHPVRSFLPRCAAYINIGQIGLAMPLFFNWLRDRPDIAPVIMLHDVIPIQHPEMVAAASVRDHARMVQTAARHADGLIVSTAAAAAEIARELARCGCDDVPTLVRALPLTKGFTRGVHPHPDLAGTDYFVVCGTIEPRKNHALLIKVWQKLIGRDGISAPHLVMVGTPGWSAEKLFELLDHSPLLRGRVHHAAGLSTPALAQLITGSRALLVPSLAEGFSLPLLEARALDVPVVASDIAVHRERADGGVRLLPVDDVPGWLAAIDTQPTRAPAPVRAVEASMGERAYFEDVLAFAEARCAAKSSAGRPARQADSSAAPLPGMLIAKDVSRLHESVRHRRGRMRSMT